MKKKFFLIFTAVVAAIALLTVGLVGCGNDDGGKDGPFPAAGFTVTLDANGGTLTGSATVTTGTDGKLASIPAAPTAPEGFAFDGWYTAATGGDMVTFDYVFEANAVIYAHWTSGGSTVFTVTLDANGGTLTGSATVTTGTDGKLASIPAAPDAPTGMKFAGWYDAAGAKVDSSYIFTADATITAHWDNLDPLEDYLGEWNRITGYDRTTMEFSYADADKLTIKTGNKFTIVMSEGTFDGNIAVSGNSFAVTPDQGSEMTGIIGDDVLIFGSIDANTGVWVKGSAASDAAKSWLESYLDELFPDSTPKYLGEHYLVYYDEDIETVKLLDSATLNIKSDGTFEFAMDVGDEETQVAGTYMVDGDTVTCVVTETGQAFTCTIVGNVLKCDLTIPDDTDTIYFYLGSDDDFYNDATSLEYLVDKLVPKVGDELGEYSKVYIDASGEFRLSESDSNSLEFTKSGRVRFSYSIPDHGSTQMSGIAYTIEDGVLTLKIDENPVTGNYVNGMAIFTYRGKTFVFAKQDGLNSDARAYLTEHKDALFINYAVTMMGKSYRVTYNKRTQTAALVEDEYITLASNGSGQLLIADYTEERNGTYTYDADGESFALELEGGSVYNVLPLGKLLFSLYNSDDVFYRGSAEDLAADSDTIAVLAEKFKNMQDEFDIYIGKYYFIEYNYYNDPHFDTYYDYFEIKESGGALVFNQYDGDFAGTTLYKNHILYLTDSEGVVWTLCHTSASADIFELISDKGRTLVIKDARSIGLPDLEYLDDSMTSVYGIIGKYGNVVYDEARAEYNVQVKHEGGADRDFVIYQDGPYIKWSFAMYGWEGYTVIGGSYYNTFYFYNTVEPKYTLRTDASSMNENLIFISGVAAHNFNILVCRYESPSTELGKINEIETWGGIALSGETTDMDDVHSSEKHISVFGKMGNYYEVTKSGGNDYTLGTSAVKILREANSYIKDSKYTLYEVELNIICGAGSVRNYEENYTTIDGKFIQMICDMELGKTFLAIVGDDGLVEKVLYNGKQADLTDARNIISSFDGTWFKTGDAALSANATYTLITRNDLDNFTMGEISSFTLQDSVTITFNTDNNCQFVSSSSGTVDGTYQYFTAGGACEIAALVGGESYYFSVGELSGSSNKAVLILRGANVFSSGCLAVYVDKTVACEEGVLKAGAVTSLDGLVGGGWLLQAMGGGGAEAEIAGTYLVYEPDNTEKAIEIDGISRIVTISSDGKIRITSKQMSDIDQSSTIVYANGAAYCPRSVDVSFGFDRYYFIVKDGVMLAYTSANDAIEYNYTCYVLISTENIEDGEIKTDTNDLIKSLLWPTV